MNEFDYLAKAKTNMDKEEYHEVISLCDKALKINGNLPKAYSFRGNARLELGEYKTAVEDFSEAIKREPNEAKHYYDRSWTYYRLDNSEYAIMDISKALELEPQNPLYIHSKGQFEYWVNRYNEAIFDITRGIKLLPTAKKYILRGDCYCELERYNEALADYNTAIEIDNENALAYYSRGYLYKILEKLELAELDFKKAIELCPYDDTSMVELGFIKIQSGSKEAMNYINNAININPTADNYYNRVKVRYTILKREDSLKHLSGGKFVKYYGDEIFNEKQAIDDIEDLNKAIELDSDNKTYIQQRSRRYIYLKQYDKALKDSEALTEIEPDNKNWYVLKAFCEMYMGKLNEAIENANRYLSMNYNNGDTDYYGIIGITNYKLGNLKEAVNVLSKGIALKETDVFYYYRGLANYKLKRFIKSYRDIKRALELNPDVEIKADCEMPKLIKLLINKFELKTSPIGLCAINSNKGKVN